MCSPGDDRFQMSAISPATAGRSAISKIHVNTIY
jgi:hypothetical protein